MGTTSFRAFKVEVQVAALSLDVRPSRRLGWRRAGRRLTNSGRKLAAPNAGPRRATV
jgi:hypothetical protein